MTVPVPDSPTSGPGLPAPGTDPEWFKRAVFYEVLVRGFADSNADGVGDLRGMIDKLDYLQWLAWNHGCWSEVWFMTKSMITRMPREWAAFRKSLKSSMSPNSGSTAV